MRVVYLNLDRATGGIGQRHHLLMSTLEATSNLVHSRVDEDAYTIRVASL
jgi:hypothetical protein